MTASLVTEIDRTTTTLPPSVLFVGSLERGTAIQFHGVSDADAYVLLHYGRLPALRSREPWLIVDDWHRSLVQSFPSTRFSCWPNCLCGTLAGIELDVLPALQESNGALLIPSSTGDYWISSQPVRLREIVITLDQKSKGQFSRCVRLAKAWNRARGGPLKSFHLESIVVAQFRTRPVFEGLWDALCTFFLSLPSALQAECRDPATRSRLDQYFQEKGGLHGLDAAMLAQRAHDIARKISCHLSEAHGVPSDIAESLIPGLFTSMTNRPSIP